MRTAATIAIGCVLAGSSAQGQLSGPVSGYVNDTRTGAIRPINGLPGASTLGPALAVRPLRAAVLRSDLDIAAGIDSESGAISLIRGLSKQPSEQQHTDWLENATGLALDTAGKQLFAWSKDLSKLVVVSSLDTEPAVTASLDTSALGEITGAGANDHVLLLAAVTDSVARLFVVPIQSGSLGEPVQTGSFQSVSAIWVSEDTAFIADREADSVFAIAGLDGARETSVLVSARDGASKPVSLYLYRDRLVIANAGDSTALVVHTGTRELTMLPLASKPTHCQRLGAEALIAMNEAGAQPITMVDLTEGVSYFVPVDLP